MEDELREKMPASVVVSMFKVNNNDPLDKYCQKYQGIVTSEIKMIAEKAKLTNFTI
jgi:hypothetical protein